MPRSVNSLLVFLIAVLATLGLAGCERDAVPPLVEVSEISPREIEVGDRIELKGAGFPQGRIARVTLRGTLLRPGQSPVPRASVETQGIVLGSDRIEVVVGEALEERFCGHGDHAAHTTMVGDVEVAFSSSTPGAPPLVGIMHGMTIDVTPVSVRASVLEARAAEGARVLAFLGVTPGLASPRGLPIETIAPGSPAERAGFQAGDRIAAVDGVHVRELADVAPASARSAQFTLHHADSVAGETKTVPMTGYAGERIPSEYAPALMLVGLALAVLVLLVLPAPVVASALELRVARRLRVLGFRTAIFALFGRGPRGIFSVLASVLVATFALGPHVVGADLDGGILLVSAIALLLAARVASTRGGMASARAAADVGIAGLVLAASIAGVVVHGGALRLAEIVRAQGGAPWEFAAVRQPVSCALAFAYVGALLVLLRAREELPASVPTLHSLRSVARVDDRAPVSAASKGAPSSVPVLEEGNGRLLERLGLLVASALGVAIFFGGWQLPGGTEARSSLLQIAAALVFVAKTWALCALILGAASIASPWTVREARTFIVRRLVPALALGGVLVVLARRIPASESLEAALGATVVTALALLLLRAALRVRGAMLRPEPHASPFL